MVAKKRTKRVVSTDIHEKFDPQSNDTMVVETITTTTTTTTKKRIYVKDSNIDLTNIQSLLDDKTDTYALPAITNTASNHSCQLTNGSNKKRIENEHFEESTNASHSPLSSTKVSNESQSDEENDPLITFNKKSIHPATKPSENLTKRSDRRVKSPNLSCIPCDKNKHLSRAKNSKTLKKKTKAISSKSMPKTPKNFKEKRIEDLISQYIPVGTVEHKSKGQSRSNNIPNATIDNHNLSDIAEASFEASDSAGNSFDGYAPEYPENDHLSSIEQNASPIKFDNEKIEFNTENTEINSQKIPKQTPVRKSQREKRGKYTKKLKSKSEDDELESDKAVETVKSAPNKGKKTRKMFEEEKEPGKMVPNKKKPKNVTKETVVVDKTEQTQPIETETVQIETVDGNKRPRDQPVARNKRSRTENTKRAEQTKSSNVDKRISETTEEQSESNKRCSKRTRAPSVQQTLRQASLEKLYAKEIKQKKKSKPSKSKKLPKTKTDPNKLNENSIDVPPQVDELPDIPMNDEPEMPINKNLFDHTIEIYSPSRCKNFKSDKDSNVIIPEALIKSKLMNLSNAPDEWMNQYNGRKEYKMKASHRLRLLLPDTTENVELNTNSNGGGGDILSRIGKLRKPILVHEFGTPTRK